MAITLDATVLPADMVWDDEFGNWEPRAQRLQYTLTGALRVRESVRLAGRPITLGLPREHGDCDRALVLTLRALSDAGAQHTLTLHDGRAFAVRWRRTDGAGAEAEPVLDYADPTPTDQYSLILRFIEV